MNNAQRALVVVALGGLMIASPIYCLEYRAVNYWTSRGFLFDNNLRPPEPVLTLGETELAPPTDTGAGVVRLTGLYPRQGMGFQAALVGGLLSPIILLVAAGYIALAGSRFIAPCLSQGREQEHSKTPAATSSPATSAQQQPEWLDKRPSVLHPKLYVFVAIAGVVWPLLWILDMPSMLLMMGLRFPRAVLVILVIEAIRVHTL